MNPLSPIEESKPAMCLSPQDKLKSATKRSHASGVLAGASDAKKARMDDMFKNEFELDLDGWISDDYLRAMDFDDRLNHDIDWVAHDEMDLVMSMDALAQYHTTGVDVNDFGFAPALLRGGLAFEDPADMASTFVDPAYIRLESSNTKDAEKLLMSFDTMNFKIPSPTSTSSKKRSSIFSEKDVEVKLEKAAVGGASSSASELAANSAAAEDLRKEQARVSAASASSSLSISASTDSLLSVLNVGSPKSSSTEKKIGSYSPAARKLRLQKFHEKRKNRTWKKSIKYDCRKKLADDRPRIKGRFVRVLENASDMKTACTSSAAAGYASPTPPTGAVAPPAMAPQTKTPVTTVSRVAASCASTLAAAAKQTPAVVTKPTPVPAPTAALPLARMIASV
ncbi:hypothetical protein PR002_g6665 [Phytophthora rubi]|uniref:CCT domain-containing protein n=1 Tax=Phytophthora rubi TaxID=129364 RepID=A0A6A3NAE1_9STRA|nr:hypothetical protein PR002_g6665 [Phytophthora rubi]